MTGKIQDQRLRRKRTLLIAWSGFALTLFLACGSISFFNWLPRIFQPYWVAAQLPVVWLIFALWVTRDEPFWRNIPLLPARGRWLLGFVSLLILWGWLLITSPLLFGFR